MSDELTDRLSQIGPGRRTPAKATLAVHADNELNIYPDVAPAIHLSTTFRYGEDAVAWADADVSHGPCLLELF
jgi:hypothetical protein